MRLSIRIRTVLAMNMLATCVGVAVGWAGIEVSSRAIERRLIGESVEGAASLAGEMNLPISDTLMARLKQILGTELAAGPADESVVSASSLSAELTGELARQFVDGQMPSRVVLGDEPYRVGTGPITFGQSEGRAPMRLFLLLPEAQLTAAQDRVARSIMWITAGAIFAATLLAFWLSGGITRPVGRLAERMDGLSRAASAGELPLRIEDAASSADPRRSPAELARLAESFDHLLAELSDARAKLARSARLAALGQLSASVAHELRNPLSGIKMNVRVLADELARANMSDPSLDLILREIDRMDLYVSQLLSAAAGAEPDIAASVGEEDRLCDLGDLIESVMPLVAPRCGQVGIEIATDLSPDDRCVRASARLVRQVVLNVLLNAIDAMPAGGSIRIHSAPAPDGAVRLAVTDSGPGVEAGEGVDVFEPFVTTKSDGAGLGLYICRQIVTARGGLIGYEPAEGGTTFWFELPRGEAAADAKRTDGDA